MRRKALSVSNNIYNINFTKDKPSVTGSNIANNIRYMDINTRNYLSAKYNQKVFEIPRVSHYVGDMFP